ncbi:MAG: hypothetical protein IKI10_07790 [Muribaculaceae bacterium]|nr:hypothetical protein [Muribaculaceae bacterium]
MKRFILLLMAALLIAPMGMASITPDDEVKDPSIKPGIRRLHPERERAKAIKKLQEQMSRKADPNADPWDTADEMWGTVDLPPVAIKDSTAVEGRRLNGTSKTATEQAALDELLNTDYSIKEYGMGIRRMVWHDEPVTATIEQLLPYITTDGGECLSKYVNREKTSNEAYFVFTFQDSVVGPLRLCVQYCADDPLNYDELTFNIDGFDYMLYPSDPQRGKLDGNLYWEMSDDELRTAHKDLVYALAHSHWVILKLKGESGISHVKMLSDGQRDDFAHIWALYRLLGGEI